jgi:hypothetical protein
VATLPRGLQSLSFRASKGAMEGPDAAAAGWAQLHQEVGEARHILVAFTLPRGVEPAVFAAALDTAVATPLGAAALGGSETPASDAIIELESGRVLVGCMSRDSAGIRHASQGEWHVVNVRARPSPAAMLAPSNVKIDVALGDFAFITAPRWPSGSQLVQVRNTGREDHLMLIARLHPGATMLDFFAAEGTNRVADPAIGISRMSAGRTGFLPMNLQPGRYVLYCLITDPATKKSHVDLGMLREIEVAATATR